MRNLIFLVLFLCLIGGLIWWLWSDRGDEKTLQQVVAEQQVAPVETGLPKVDLDEVEIAYDENGLFITKLYNQDVDLTLSEKPVRNVEVFDGVMTYQEETDGKWNFRSYNLGQYIEQNLKAE